MALLVGAIAWVIQRAGIYTSTVLKKNMRRRRVVFMTLAYAAGSIGLSVTHTLQTMMLIRR